MLAGVLSGIIIYEFFLSKTFGSKAIFIFVFLPILLGSIWDIVFLNQWNWATNEYEFLNVHPTRWKNILVVKNLLTMLSLSLIFVISWIFIWLLHIIDIQKLLLCIGILWIIPLIMVFGNIVSSIKKDNKRRFRWYWICILFIVKTNLISFHLILFKGIVLPIILYIVSITVWWFSIRKCSVWRSKIVLEELI